MENFYSCQEVAELFGVKPATIQKWIRMGELSAMQTGKLIRISDSDIAAYKRAHMIVPNNKEG